MKAQKIHQHHRRHHQYKHNKHKFRINRERQNTQQDTTIFQNLKRVISIQKGKTSPLDTLLAREMKN